MLAGLVLTQNIEISLKPVKTFHFRIDGDAELLISTDTSLGLGKEMIRFL